MEIRCRVTDSVLRAQRQHQHRLSKWYSSSSSQCWWISRTKAGCSSKQWSSSSSSRSCLQAIANRHWSRGVLYPTTQQELSSRKLCHQKAKEDQELPAEKRNSTLARSLVTSQFSKTLLILTHQWARKLQVRLTLKLVDCALKMFNKSAKGSTTMWWSSVWPPTIWKMRTLNLGLAYIWSRPNCWEKIESLMILCSSRNRILACHRVNLCQEGQVLLKEKLI